MVERPVKCSPDICSALLFLIYIPGFERSKLRSSVVREATSAAGRRINLARNSKAVKREIRLIAGSKLYESKIHKRAKVNLLR